MANEVHSPHTIKTDMGKLVINSEANTSSSLLSAEACKTHSI